LISKADDTCRFDGNYYRAAPVILPGMALQPFAIADSGDWYGFCFSISTRIKFSFDLPLTKHMKRAIEK